MGEKKYSETEMEYPMWNLIPCNWDSLVDVLNDINNRKLSAEQWMMHYSLKKKEKE
jgi:hypothetical protein